MLGGTGKPIRKRGHSAAPLLPHSMVHTWAGLDHGPTGFPAHAWPPPDHLAPRPLCAHPTRGTKGGERGRSRTPACPSPFLSFPPLDWKPPQNSEETRSASALGVKSGDFPSKILPPKLFSVQGTWSPAGEAFLGMEIGWGRALRNPAQSQLFLCGHWGAWAGAERIGGNRPRQGSGEQPGRDGEALSRWLPLGFSHPCTCSLVSLTRRISRWTRTVSVRRGPSTQ